VSQSNTQLLSFLGAGVCFFLTTVHSLWTMWSHPVWSAHLWSCFVSQRWRCMPSASALPSPRLSAFTSNGSAEPYLWAYPSVFLLKAEDRAHFWNPCVCVFIFRARRMSSSLAWSTPGPCVSLQSRWPTASHVPSLHHLVRNIPTDPHLPLLSFHFLSFFGNTISSGFWSWC